MYLKRGFHDFGFWILCRQICRQIFSIFSFYIYIVTNLHSTNATPKSLLFWNTLELSLNCNFDAVKRAGVNILILRAIKLHCRWHTKKSPCAQVCCNLINSTKIRRRTKSASSLSAARDDVRRFPPERSGPPSLRKTRGALHFLARSSFSLSRPQLSAAARSYYTRLQPAYSPASDPRRFHASVRGCFAARDFSIRLGRICCCCRGEKERRDDCIRARTALANSRERFGSLTPPRRSS